MCLLEVDIETNVGIVIYVVDNAKADRALRASDDDCRIRKLVVEVDLAVLEDSLSISGCRVDPTRPLYLKGEVVRRSVGYQVGTSLLIVLLDNHVVDVRSYLV